MTRQTPKQSKKAMPRKKMARAKLVKEFKGAPSFGPVSTITTAPVAIGNSIQGSKPNVIMSVDGCRVTGRDFAFTATSTPASVTGWTLVGGMPLTPSVLASSSLKSYTQMYSKFKINAIAAHYITSSATTQTGDVLFYFERERNGPFIDWTNNSFLPFTLSDPNTILGPQWSNHTAIFRPTTEFKTTDYGVNLDLNEDVCGQLCLFSKTSSASSPGYVILDYDITFKELQVNPRAGVLPISRGQFSPINLSLTATAVTSGTTTVAPLYTSGNAVTGATTSSPSGLTPGDIYRVIFDVSNSTITNAAWTNVTTSTLLRYEFGISGDATTSVDDGFTAYGVVEGSTLVLYPTLTNALSGLKPFTYGTTATITFNLNVMISLVAQLNNQSQASY